MALGPVPFYNALKPITSLPASLDVPTARIKFGNLSESDKEEIRGLGMREEEGKPGVFVGSPASASVGTLFAKGPVDYRHSPGVVSLEGYLAYCASLKIVQVVAFGTHIAKGGVTNLLVRKEGIGLSRSADMEFLQDTMSGSVVMKKLDGYKQPDGLALVVAPGVETIIYPVNSSGTIPSFFKRSTTALTGEGGRFFPYFSGMTLPDKNYLIFTFQQYINLMGRNAEIASGVWAKIKTGFSDLASTSSGRILGHIAMGLNLAVSSESRLTIIEDNNVYRGFVLQNDDLWVVMYGKTYKAVPLPDLNTDLESVNAHGRAIQAVLTLLNCARKSDGNTPVYNFTERDIATSSGLRQTLHQIELANYSAISDFQEDLINRMKELEYGESFPEANFKTISAFATYVDTGDISVLDPYPFYITNHALDFSRVTTGLSIFGTRVPTLNYGNTKDSKFNLPSSADVEDPNLTLVEGKRYLRFLPFALVTYGTGIIHWNALYSQGSFYLPSGKKGTVEFTDKKKYSFTVGGDKQFPALYRSIKSHSIAVRDGLRGGKRRRDGEDKEEGPSKIKKAKLDAELGAEI
jgi:hypothetical protein